jgi:hypothetical protein
MYALQSADTGKRIKEAAQKLQQSSSTNAWLQRMTILKLHMI